jgi:WhiB family transcriptional regulator, redox-sensing transcriptional regulator
VEIEVLVEAVRELEWTRRASCGSLPARKADRIFFPERGGSLKRARVICARCPVKAECLAYALEKGEAFGIWGGTSEKERRELQRTRRKRAIPRVA